jgi:hypothetical protein
MHSPMMCVDASRRKYRFVDFLIQLKIRDGYTCVVTGFQDLLHPNPNADFQSVALVGAHILRRAIGEFNEKSVGRLSIQSTISR